MMQSHMSQEAEAEETASKPQIKGLWEENNKGRYIQQRANLLLISLSELK